jgi:hypothetical protein
LRMRLLTHASMCCQVIVYRDKAGHSFGRGLDPLLTPHPCLGRA